MRDSARQGQDLDREPAGYVSLLAARTARIYAAVAPALLFGALIFAEEPQASVSSRAVNLPLRLLTLNVKMTAGDWATDRLGNFKVDGCDDQEGGGVFASGGYECRANKIAQRIKQYGYDVVVLEECSASSCRDQMLKDLHDNGPYTNYISKLDGQTNAQIDSGLMVFSKYPIEKPDWQMSSYKDNGIDDCSHNPEVVAASAGNHFSPHVIYLSTSPSVGAAADHEQFASSDVAPVKFHVFGNCSGYDCMADKGVGFFRIKADFGSWTDVAGNGVTGGVQYFNIFFTHMQASDAATNVTQHQEVKAFMRCVLAQMPGGYYETTAPHQENLVLLGDLNMENGKLGKDNGWTVADGMWHSLLAQNGDRAQASQSSDAKQYGNKPFYLHDVWAWDNSYGTTVTQDANLIDAWPYGGDPGATGDGGISDRLDIIAFSPAGWTYGSTFGPATCMQHATIEWNLRRPDKSPSTLGGYGGDGAEGLTAVSDHEGVSGAFYFRIPNRGCSPMGATADPAMVQFENTPPAQSPFDGPTQTVKTKDAQGNPLPKSWHWAEFDTPFETQWYMISKAGTYEFNVNPKNWTDSCSKDADCAPVGGSCKPAASGSTLKNTCQGPGYTPSHTDNGLIYQVYSLSDMSRPLTGFAHVQGALPPACGFDPPPGGFGFVPPSGCLPGWADDIYTLDRAPFLVKVSFRGTWNGPFKYPFQYRRHDCSEKTAPCVLNPSSTIKGHWERDAPQDKYFLFRVTHFDTFPLATLPPPTTPSGESVTQGNDPNPADHYQELLFQIADMTGPTAVTHLQTSTIEWYNTTPDANPHVYDTTEAAGGASDQRYYSMYKSGWPAGFTDKDTAEAIYGHRHVSANFASNTHVNPQAWSFIGSQEGGGFGPYNQNCSSAKHTAACIGAPSNSEMYGWNGFDAIDWGHQLDSQDRFYFLHVRRDSPQPPAQRAPFEYEVYWTTNLVYVSDGYGLPAGGGIAWSLGNSDSMNRFTDDMIYAEWRAGDAATSLYQTSAGGGSAVGKALTEESDDGPPARFMGYYDENDNGYPLDALFVGTNDIGETFITRHALRVRDHDGVSWKLLNADSFPYSDGVCNHGSHWVPPANQVLFNSDALSQHAIQQVNTRDICRDEDDVPSTPGCAFDGTPSNFVCAAHGWDEDYKPDPVCVFYMPALSFPYGLVCAKSIDNWLTIRTNYQMHYNLTPAKLPQYCEHQSECAGPGRNVDTPCCVAGQCNKCF